MKYYIGYEVNGKLYPLGPYDCNGKLHDVLGNHRDVWSNIYLDFNSIKEEQISDELRKEFKNEINQNNQVMEWLYVDDLPKGSYIRSAYFLVRDVEQYERYENSGNRAYADEYHCDIVGDDLFSDHLSPTSYAALVQNEITFADDYNLEESSFHSASEYMYYSYPDYTSREYEADIFRTIAYMLGTQNSELPKGYRLVVLLSEKTK